MKYIKPKFQLIELNEDLNCVCGSICTCRGRHKDPCDCLGRHPQHPEHPHHNVNIWEKEW